MTKSRDLANESKESEPSLALAPAASLETSPSKTKNSSKKRKRERERSSKKKNLETEKAVVAKNDSSSSKKKLSETEIERSGTDDDDSKDKKKLLFQRVWSEEDEIVVLQGMIDYREKKKVDPMSDLNAFHEFIKKSILIDNFSKAQLKDKIRRFKKKYENNFTKEYKKTKKGKNYKVTSSNPHEQMIYELSKQVWGDNDNDLIIGSWRIVKKLEMDFEHFKILLEKMREDNKFTRLKEAVEKLELDLDHAKIILKKMKKEVKN